MMDGLSKHQQMQSQRGAPMSPRFQWALCWSCCQILYTALSTFVCCCFCYPSQHLLFLGLRLLIILSLYSSVVPTGYVEVFILKVLRSPPKLGCPLWNICFTNNHGYVPFVVITRFENQINTTSATSGAGTAYPSGADVFTHSFQGGPCYSIFSFMCMSCR